MNKNDFRYMFQQKQVRDLDDSDYSLIAPIQQVSATKRRALLLIHGFTSSAAVYRCLIPQLKTYDAIFCPNLPGHGSSIQEMQQATAQEWLACGRELAVSLLNEYEQVDVAGLSLGGLLVSLLAAEYQFNRIFLFAPALKLCMNERTYLKLAQALYYLGFRELRGSAGSIMQPGQEEISYRRLPIASVKELFRLILSYQYQPMNAPTELFLGRHDAVVSSQSVADLFANDPNATIHWLDNTAHVITLDGDLAQIIDCMNQYS